VSLLILCTTNFQLSEVEQVAVDNTEDSGNIPELSIKSFDIFNSSTQVALNHQFVLVRELEEESDEEISNDIKHQMLTHCNRAFKVLFRRIISPNAP